MRDRIFGHAKRPSLNNVGGANTGNMETSEKLSRPQGRMREANDGTGGNRVREAFSKTTKVSGRSDLREARACTIRKATVFPKKAQNMAGNFMFIVNAGEHRQAVDIELCMNEGMECTNQEDAPSGQTACRQKYTA